MVTRVVPTHPAPLAARWRRDGHWGADTLWSAYARTGAAAPSRVALVEADRSFTFGDVCLAAEHLADRLGALGIGVGDVVAFQLPNWWETVVLYLAAARLGAVANPILPIARERELRFILHSSGARVFFIPGQLRDCDHRMLAGAVRQTLPDLEHVVTVRSEAGPGMIAWPDLPAGRRAAPAPDAEAIALVMYTSGTTADPKGVLHSHATLLSKACSLGPVHALRPTDTVLMPSPLTHVSGLLYAVLVPAIHGTRSVLMPRWNTADALALIARDRVTYMIGAPTFLRELADHPRLSDTDVTSFRLFSCGGATVDPELIRSAADRLRCVAKRVYGSTEFPTLSTTGPDDPPDTRIHTEGRPVGAAEIRVVDESGRTLAAGREGELQARGPECFLGYRDARLNAAAFTDDGWYRTGDLATIDQAGYLRITGRLADVIIRKGENISAREVEDLAVTHPAIAEVAVIGLPDPIAGEVACAVVRLRSGAAAPTVETLGRHLLAAGLSKRKLPERVEVIEAFPRTESGKILKRALRRRFAPAPVDTPPAPRALR